MKISREDVLRVAELAYLDLSEAELETYRAQLDEILEYIGKLNELDTVECGADGAGVGGRPDGGRDFEGRPGGAVRCGGRSVEASARPRAAVFPCAESD